MDRPYKYITVLDYLNGQVYVYDYDAILFDGDAETFVTIRHDLDNVYFMVHKDKPQLYAKKLSYGG